MAVLNINLIWELMSQLHETQALACGGDGCGDGGRPENVSPKKSMFCQFHVCYAFGYTMPIDLKIHVCCYKSIFYQTIEHHSSEFE